ncbi:MAG TPA: molybdopterin-dependent oxidoreductase, partial [Pseudonocardia sp.]
MIRSVIRTCPLCESTCGLELTFSGERLTDIRGDRLDVFSGGYLCPKGTTLGQLHSDPDRLRAPLVRQRGRFVEASWDEAFERVWQLFEPVLRDGGPEATAIYQGNPVAHTMSLTLYPSVVVRALRTTKIFTASTVDSRPRDLSSALVFGERFSCPIPDVDRTDFLLVLGANPAVSNGSLATAPNWPGRLKALTGRGGTLVVVDPRRTRTAELATEHLAVRPGGDAALLLGMLQVIFADRLVRLGRADGLVTRLDQVRELVAPFTPERVAGRTGLDPATVRRVARAFAGARTACAYGRMGTTTGPHGTVTTWLIDLLNILTGNLDSPGGAMFTRPAAKWASNARGGPRYGKPLRLHRYRSRVRGAGETLGELPVNCLAEEIDTPGEGQIRALVTVAGNPVVSAPDVARLDRALAGLDAMVAVDCFVNETTRHADVILPPPSVLERPHYDFAMMQYAVRNVANYSPAPLDPPPGQPHEWELLCRLAGALRGEPDADPNAEDE